MAMPIEVPVIRTSDRGQFKQCRRLWNWRSAMRENRSPIGDVITPLWLGSGIHYGLEDFHSHNIYGHASAALEAYAKAFRIGGKPVPDDWEEAIELGMGMLDYYENYWLEGRDPLETYVVDGVYQVEKNILVEIELPEPIHGHKIVRYGATLDRMSIDEHDRLWIVEYKSAKAFEQEHFLTDPQVTAYCWLAWIYYGKPVAGVVYQQHRKDVPKPPRILADGTVSVNKTQLTTSRLYRETLLQLFGKVDKAPAQNVHFLNHLNQNETDEADRFVRRDFVHRNEHQLRNEGQRVISELHDILDPNLQMYPHQTRNCSYCSFLSPCVSMDDGSDWEHELNLTTYKREQKEYDESWRQYLPAPKAQ